MTINAIWKKAPGNCGMNVKKGVPVFGAYVNGIPLFAYESRATPFGRPQFTCLLVGLNAIHGESLAEVQEKGVRAATSAIWVCHPDRKMSVVEFDALMGVNHVRPEPTNLRRKRKSSKKSVAAVALAA